MSFLVKDILEKFEVDFLGNKESIISEIGRMDQQNSNSLYWSKNKENLSLVEVGSVICKKSDFDEIVAKENVNYIFASNPRLTFAKTITSFFQDKLSDDFTNDVQTHRLNKSIIIGDNVFIGKNVTIGSGTKIHHNTVIYSNTIVGSNCIINVGASIGTEGLGLEKDPETNTLFKFPQIGNVRLADFVEVGPYSTIRRSALNETYIGKSTKIGSFCNIGHNSQIGSNCILTSNVIIAGSSKIGNDVFLGVSCNIKNAIVINDNATVGQGAVVVSNIGENETWVGNPAKKIK